MNQEHERLLDFSNRVRWATSGMGTPILSSFCIVDYIFCPEYFWEFLLIRLCVYPISFLCGRLNQKGLKYTELSANLFVLFLSFTITYFCWKTGAEKSQYYAGINLIAIGSLTFLPWRPSGLKFNAAAIFTPYVFMLTLSTPLDLHYTVPTVGFMGCTFLIGFIINHLNTQMRSKEFNARMDLAKEVSTREDTIRMKTDEGTKLKRLTSHFSPTVTKSILDGTVSLTKMTRKKISVICYDIKDSTRRSTLLDHDEYLQVLREFFTFSDDFFKRKNLTLSNIEGDFRLILVNAPMDQSEHEQLAIQASIEFLKEFKKRSFAWSEKWRAPFEIRISVHSDYASVGFFPNFETGGFTAIGSSLNLLRRLCSAAEPNSICITKDFLLKVTDSVKDLDVVAGPNVTSFKGFQDELRKTYILLDKSEVQTKADNNHCPLCNSSIVIKEEVGEFYLLKCSKCSFQDLVDKVADAKAA